MATPERTHAAAHAGYWRSSSAMPPRASGAIETHAWRDGRTVTIRARVRAYGRRYRVDFGTNHEGWSVERARVELDRILQQVERGTWEPRSSDNGASAALDAEETVHVTASHLAGSDGTSRSTRIEIGRVYRGREGRVAGRPRGPSVRAGAARGSAHRSSEHRDSA